MRKFYLLMAASVSCVAVSTAYAQDAASPTTTGQQPDTTGVSEGMGDIIVTARRVDERLQDVPASVAVVSGDTVQKLNLLRLEEVEVLSPGLDLDVGTGGFTAGASMRGLEYNASSGANPTVDIYVNDVPVDMNIALSSMYDVGQIEVLRGPQGTLRGRPSPSGAITLTTKRPDLNEIGGYMNFLASDRDALMGQGAVNVPIVPGILAVRVAGVVDKSEGDGIRSINSGRKPRSDVDSFRVTTMLKPTDNLEFLLTYQELRTNSLRFPQVFGTGYVQTGPFDGAGNPQPPSNYNGPALTSRDRLSVAERPDTVDQFQRFISWQGRLQIPAIKSELIYIGAHQKQLTSAQNVDDDGNSILNYAGGQTLSIPIDNETHELRLQSVGNGVLDYVVGLWSQKTNSVTTFAAPTAFAGAFGPPGSYTGPVIDPLYTIFPLGTVAKSTSSKAIFANLTAHLSDRLEISAGARYNHVKTEGLNTTTYDQGRYAAFQAPPFFCAFVPPGYVPSASYPGFCDLIIPATNTAIPLNREEKPWTYQGSIKYKFNDNLMAYASYGHSWREGPVNLALQNTGNPAIAGLVMTESETSDTYEVGLKGSALDGRLQFSAAVFQQQFPNLIIAVDTVYLGDPGQGGTRAVVEPGNGSLLTNAKARIRGFEAEANFRITPNWTFGISGSYAKGRIDDSVPCRDGNGDGIPDNALISGAGGIQALSDQAAANPNAPPPPGALTQANPIAYCQSNRSTAALPNWSLTAQSEVSFPFGDDDEFYLRGLFSYKPTNSNALGGYVVPSDANLNLYAGVRLNERFDIGVFAKNVFNQDDETFRDSDEILGEAGLMPTGYFRTARTRPREVGLTIRGSFGSR